MLRDSKEHLKSVNETYFKHLKAAISIGCEMIIGGFQAIVHAFYPGILQKTASDKIKKLYLIISKRTD